MRLLSLFSGIGGLDLAAEWAGFSPVAFVEQNDFCQKVLAKHWPTVPIFNDVRTFDATQFTGVAGVIGGFPCQDISLPGKGAGIDGERSGLWFEMLRVVQECCPRFVVAENVGGLVNRGLDRVLSDLETEGYTAEALLFPASATGAPHRRERFFIVAHTNSKPGTQASSATRPLGGRRDARHDALRCARGAAPRGDWAVYPSRVFGMDDGIPNRVDRATALGNAVSPQQAYPVFKALAERMSQL